jgi:hypothetical protein
MRLLSHAQVFQLLIFASLRLSQAKNVPLLDLRQPKNTGFVKLFSLPHPRRESLAPQTWHANHTHQASHLSYCNDPLAQVMPPITNSTAINDNAQRANHLIEFDVNFHSLYAAYRYATIHAAHTTRVTASDISHNVLNARLNNQSTTDNHNDNDDQQQPEQQPEQQLEQQLEQQPEQQPEQDCVSIMDSELERQKTDDVFALGCIIAELFTPDQQPLFTELSLRKYQTNPRKHHPKLTHVRTTHLR